MDRRRCLALVCGLGGSALLAACGSPAPRTARLRPTPRLTTAQVPRTEFPSIAVVNPLDLDATGREEAVARAVLAINTPYTYGGNTLEGGFDCSGLVQYVFAGFAGRPLPRSTRQWAQVSRPVDTALLQRGDLVFFNTTGAAFSHMGIYMGGQQFVHAPSTGGIVRTARIDGPYFAQRFDGGRTVFGA